MMVSDGSRPTGLDGKPTYPSTLSTPPSFSTKSFSDLFVKPSPGHPTLATKSSSPLFLTKDTNVLGEKTPSMHRGEVAVFFSKEEIDSMASPFSLALVGKFSKGRPALEEIRKFLSSLHLKDSIIVGLLDSRHILIRCKDEVDFLRIWSKAVWNVLGFTMRVFRWTAHFHVDRESHLAPAWIEFPRLPIHLFNKDALFSIASILGRPLMLDSATSQLSRPSVARVLVEVELRKELPARVWIGYSENDGFWQSIEPVNVPKFCSCCFRVGHGFEECRKYKQQERSSGAPIVPVQNSVRHNQNLVYRPKKDEELRRASDRETPDLGVQSNKGQLPDWNRAVIERSAPMSDGTPYVSAPGIGSEFLENDQNFSVELKISKDAEVEKEVHREVELEVQTAADGPPGREMEPALSASELRDTAGFVEEIGGQDNVEPVTKQLKTKRSHFTHSRSEVGDGCLHVGEIGSGMQTKTVLSTKCANQKGQHALENFRGFQSTDCLAGANSDQEHSEDFKHTKDVAKTMEDSEMTQKHEQTICNKSLPKIPQQVDASPNFCSILGESPARDAHRILLCPGQKKVEYFKNTPLKHILTGATSKSAKHFNGKSMRVQLPNQQNILQKRIHVGHEKAILLTQKDKTFEAVDARVEDDTIVDERPNGWGANDSIASPSRFSVLNNEGEDCRLMVDGAEVELQAQLENIIAPGGLSPRKVRGFKGVRCDSKKELRVSRLNAKRGFFLDRTSTANSL